MAIVESNIATGSNVAPQEKSLGELFADLSRETTTLVREEVRLAQAEMTQKATRLGKGAGMIAAGGFVAYVGLLALVAAIILGLAAAGMAAWAAALLVGGIFVIGGIIVAWQGMAALKRIDPMPRQTIETLKEDKEWLKGTH